MGHGASIIFSPVTGNFRLLGWVLDHVHLPLKTKAARDAVRLVWGEFGCHVCGDNDFGPWCVVGGRVLCDVCADDADRIATVDRLTDMGLLERASRPAACDPTSSLPRCACECGRLDATWRGDTLRCYACDECHERDAPDPVRDGWVGSDGLP